MNNSFIFFINFLLFLFLVFVIFVVTLFKKELKIKNNQELKVQDSMLYISNYKNKIIYFDEKTQKELSLIEDLNIENNDIFYIFSKSNKNIKVNSFNYFLNQNGRIKNFEVIIKPNSFNYFVIKKEENKKIIYYFYKNL